ncbi:MAG: sulfur carrier protein ThiS [Myxococcota bacterium]
MQIHLNGEPKDVPEGVTVRELLELLSITAPRVAVEVNAQVVKKARHAETALQPGDQVEIVTFVGGG